MLRALDAGLSLQDFEIMTTGMILDYVITANNDRFEDDGGTRDATQADYDNF